MKYKYKKFLKAAYINYDEDYCGCGSSTFIKPTITTPIIVITGNTAIIACAVNGATIYYTLDGSTPTSSSTEYTGAITLTQSCTIKAIAVRPGMTDSAVASESYVHYLTQWKIVGNSEVKTLPYPDGVVLPTGYKRCKYLEFHGTEYFESGIASKEGIGITCRFKTTTAEKFLFGVRNGNNQDLTNYKSSFALYPKANSRALIGYGSILQEVSNVNLIDDVEHTLQLNDTIAKVDNTDITFTRETIVTPWNIPIGTARSGAVIDSRYYIGYLYSFILYDVNGTLFNGIPCLDDNNVPCLYDTISQTTLYNQGTGTLGYEVEPQPTEIWSCGEYNATDGKYHILVQPLGGSVADIALTEPLRKAGDVADTIEFPSETDGKALVTRNLRSYTRNSLLAISISGDKVTCSVVAGGTPIYNASGSVKPNLMCDSLEVRKYTGISQAVGTFITHFSTSILVRNSYIEQTKEAYQDWLDTLGEVTFIYQLGTPTTELVDAPQIEEADSYSMVISQGAKAVSWSSFETE